MEAAALGWLAYHLTGSTVLLGEVSAAGTAPMVIFAMWGGWIADHYPKRSILLVTQVAWTVTAFAIFVLTWTGVVQPWHLIVVALFNGVINGFDLPARQSFVMEMTSRDELLAGLSLNSSVVNGTRIIGPAFAGLIIKHMGPSTGPAWCFFLNTISFFASIIGLLMMRMPLHVRPVRVETPVKQILSGFRYVLDNFRVLVLMSLFAVVGIFGWSYNVLLPAFAKDILHLDPGGFGNLMSASGIGALIGAIIMTTYGDLFPKRGTVFASIWYFSVILVLLSLNRNYHLGTGAPGVEQLRNDDLLFHGQHADSDQCPRRNAWARHGGLVAHVWGGDSYRKPGGGRACQRRGHSGDDHLGSGHLRHCRGGYTRRRAAQESCKNVIFLLVVDGLGGYNRAGHHRKTDLISNSAYL